MRASSQGSSATDTRSTLSRDRRPPSPRCNRWARHPSAATSTAPRSSRLPAIDAVVHAAALFRFAGPRAPYFRANVTGTEALLDASQRAGAATFIYISASAVVMDGKGTPLRNVDESAPIYPHSFSGYIASKARGEAAVLAANKPGFRTIALRPPAIWGPGGPFSKQLPRCHRVRSVRVHRTR